MNDAVKATWCQGFASENGKRARFSSAVSDFAGPRMNSRSAPLCPRQNSAQRAFPGETLNKYGTHSSRASSLPQSRATVGASLLATILVQTFPSGWVGRIAALLLAFCAAMVTSVAHAQCPIDSIHRAGFDVEGSGVGIDGHLAGLTSATVELRTGNTVLAATEASNGTFNLEVPVLDSATMLELRARGLPDQGEDFIELASYLGSAGHLRDRSQFDGRVRVAELPAVALSAKNTATYALLQLAHPGDPVANECELAARIAALDQGDVLNAAAVIKIVIADGGFAANGIAGDSTQGAAPATTLELLLDPSAFNSEAAAIESETPGRIAALEAVLGESFCAMFDPEAILAYGLDGSQLNSLGGEIYQRVDASSGTHVNAYGADDYQWTCVGDTVDVVFEGQRVTLNYPTRIIDGIPQQVTAEVRTFSSRLTRIDSEAGFVTLAQFSVNQQSFPFHPMLPTEHYGEESPWALVRQASGTPYNEATVNGSYLMPASGLSGDRSASAVWLDPGNTGLDIDGGNVPMTWDVSPSGDLLLSFANRNVRIIPLRDEAPSVSQVIALVDFNNGTRAIAHRLAFKLTDVSWWDNTTSSVHGAYQQHAGRVAGESTFRFELQPNSVAPTFETYFAGEFQGQEFQGATYYWSHYLGLYPRRIDLRRCVGTDGNGNAVERIIVDRNPMTGECTQFYRLRRWMLYTSNGNDLFFREDNWDWYSDPTLGDPPWYQHSRPIMYRFSAPLPMPPLAPDPGSPRATRGQIQMQ